MKTKTGRHINIKLVSAVGLCSFSVVAITVSTIAWFTTLKVIDNDNSGMRIVAPNSYFDYVSLHEVVNINYSTQQYQFNRTEKGRAYLDGELGQVVTSGEFSIDMGEFSLIDPLHPILMLIHLNQEYDLDDPNKEIDYINVYAESSSKDYFALADEDGNPIHEIAQEGNPLSSVVAFYAKSYLSTDAFITTAGSYSDDGGTYSTYDLPIAEYVDNYAGFDRTTFVEFNETTKEYSGFDSTQNLFTVTTGKHEYIAIIVEYYSYALEYIYSTYLSNPVLNETIYFSCDWSMVI